MKNGLPHTCGGELKRGALFTHYFYISFSLSTVKILSSLNKETVGVYVPLLMVYA